MFASTIVTDHVNAANSECESQKANQIGKKRAIKTAARLDPDANDSPNSSLENAMQTKR
jgi:hypothetical protein